MDRGMDMDMDRGMGMDMDMDMDRGMFMSWLKVNTISLLGDHTRIMGWDFT